MKDKIILGYISLDEDNKPYRTKPYRTKRGGYATKNPPRIYTTMARAMLYSPVGCGVAVYVDSINIQPDGTF